MLDRIAAFFKNIFNSRIIPIVFIYAVLFCILIMRMFSLQIVSSDSFVDNTVYTDEKERDIKSTRGKIYDCNGNLLASNEISYAVTIEDTGEIETNEEKNKMIYKMLSIIKNNKDTVDIDFDILGHKEEQIFKIVVSAKINSENKPGYTISVLSATFFRINGETQEQEKVNLLQYSGVQMAIANLRAYIEDITSVYPLGKYTLPTFDLQDLLNRKAETISNNQQ